MRTRLAGPSIRRTRLLRVTVALFAVFSATHRASLVNSPTVPREWRLTVRESAGIARSGEMIRSGVPVPRSLNLRDPGAPVLADSAGTPVAEFHVLARFGYPSASPAPPRGSQRCASYRTVTRTSLE